MYKQAQPFPRNVPHKKGFALILTLSALAVIIALTAVLISYLDEARKDSSASKAMIQGDLYYTDIKKVFKGFKDKKSLYAVLYLSPIPLLSEDGRFSVTVACKPIAKGVNINWLALANDANMSDRYDAAQKVFETIIQSYDLEDASKLESLLFEEIGSKKKMVLKEQSRLPQKNGIITYKQFTDILDRYQYESDDAKVGTVPWDKYFVFNPVSKYPEDNLIDGDYISAELLAVLFDIDLESVKDEWVEGAIALKTFVENMGSTYEQNLYAQGFLPQSRCEVQYDYEGERFGFVFEDIEGEVKYFEFLGKE